MKALAGRAKFGILANHHRLHPGVKDFATGAPIALNAAMWQRTTVSGVWFGQNHPHSQRLWPNTILNSQTLRRTPAPRDGMVAALPRRHRNVPRIWC